MHNFYFTTRRALRTNLAGIRDVLRKSGAYDMADNIPKDPSSCSSDFRLDPVTRQFITCPACFCLYPYNPGDDPSNIQYPALAKCTHQKTPASPPCQAPLWHQREIGGNRMRWAPRKKHIHQDLKSWLGRLLSRKGIEELLNSHPHGPPEDPNEPIDDIWRSKVFLNLRDPSGNPFYPGSEQEGRLVFSLSVDGFNPFHMKTAKQTVSSTGVWLVLLNLPPHLRYLPGNMYHACTIAGHPSLDEINHALQLVVHDLLDFWEEGVFFSRTYQYRAGRLYRAMLVPFVADMMAARQVIGLPGTTTAHYFCTLCDLDFDDIDILDRAEWPQKDAHEFRHFAALWKKAENEDHQESIFEAFGVRWSALLALPYWNPVLFTIIDSMHALDLNLFQHHIRTFFGINLLKPGSDATYPPNRVVHDKRVTSSEDKKKVEDCLSLIRQGDNALLYKLLNYHRRVLYTICVDYDIRGPGNQLVVGTRWILAKNITRWVMWFPSLILMPILMFLMHILL